MSGTLENADLITVNRARGLAIDNGILYVSSVGNGGATDGTIGSYNLNGTAINSSLITGLNNPSDVNVVPEPSIIGLAGLGVGAFIMYRRRK